MRNKLSSALVIVIAILFSACGGEEGDWNVGAKEQGLQTIDHARFIAPKSSNLIGVGTSSCSGHEINSWGDEAQGGYQYVSCSYWYMAEWGPGYHTDDMGSCVNGVVTSDSYDSAWSFR